MFVAIANCGSMRIVSERFFMSQSALSQNIKKLENELGCILLDRSHSPLKPTIYGKIVLDRAERILFLANEIEEEIARRKRTEAQMINVGTFYPTLANSEMVYVANARPELNFQVVIDDEPEILSGLIKGGFDFVFLSKPQSIPGFESFELTREQLYVSLPNNSQSAAEESIRCADLLHLEVTVPIDLDGVSSWYREFLDGINMDPDNIKELKSEEYFAAMVDPDVIHFRSSLMTAPLTMLTKKRHLPLVEPEVWLPIIVMYPIVKAEQLKPIFETLRRGVQSASAISIIPKLLQFSASSNLVIAESPKGYA